MPDRLRIDPNIHRALALPPEVYHQAQWYERMRQSVFTRTWHPYPGPLPDLTAGSLHPWNLLAGCLDEPLLLTEDDDGLHLVSNVCTHRGAILVERPRQADELRCGYHGRRFSLSGRFLGAPGFEPAEDFPRPCDNLAPVPWQRWPPFVFASLDPAHALSELTAPLQQRLGHLPWADLLYDPDYSRDYHFAASWVLYCDHYLEGRHDLATQPPPEGRPAEPRTIERWPRGVLQIEQAREDDPHVLRAPTGHVDHGLAVAAYRCWLFPCTMLDVYPWGVSLRVVIPLGVQRTRVVIVSYAWDPTQRAEGTRARLDQMEHEGGLAIESAARGVKSRHGRRARYAPSHEPGVHHFHRLLAEFIDP